MSDAAVTSKGQITIPVEVRRALGLKARDRVVFTTLMDGTVVLRAKTRALAELAARVPAGRRGVGVESMRYRGSRRG
jgi:AbrB family looped-hinge helix DNA binding protein